MAMAYSVSTVATFCTCWVTRGGITPDTKKENNEISSLHAVITSHVVVFFVFNELRWEVIVRFADIGGIVENLSPLRKWKVFVTSLSKYVIQWTIVESGVKHHTLVFLSFCTFSFGHCIVCFSSIYGFWLPLWYILTLLNST